MAGKSSVGVDSTSEVSSSASGGVSAGTDGKKQQPDSSRWVVIYPAYLDKRRTESEGRKVSLEYAVNAPHAIEIFKVVASMGLQGHLELAKSYSRDFFVKGRVRVKLFDENHCPLRSDLCNRKALRIAIAKELVKWRLQNGSMEKHGDPLSLISLNKSNENESKSSSANVNASSSSSSSNKKKSKGRK
eukprot:CAMPEP_0182444410 /NCGR_PEP_ID=MMETSP1172-20130603/2872_1 /TAXON_ID=708627 /ORGANISM="Timspurckia oligopyrenoides, Strain CCMP3278" /LENGTH=187 /DNA_ID=CAMNT_0024639959 /DNA_START=28 /DNA_END=591 /DNA_ORIENTATION=-